MGVAEIVLIIVGCIILVLSYVVPNKKDMTEESKPQVNDEQIKELVEKEIGDAKKHISNIVDETVTYSMEKTERAMERLANEKIMAVNEYSDSVLEEINKNHNEVIFLYDMLNDKHDNLVSTVSEATKTAKEIQQTVQEVGTTAGEMAQLLEEPGKTIETAQINQSEEAEFTPIAPQIVEIKGDIAANVNTENMCETRTAESGAGARGINNNEKILVLHKLGKSHTEIARELGLGIGEVKLVIGLFEQG